MRPSSSARSHHLTLRPDEEERLRRCPDRDLRSGITADQCGTDLRVELYRSRARKAVGDVYRSLPLADRRALETELVRTQTTDAFAPDRRLRRIRLCRGAIAGGYTLASLRSADVVCLARMGPNGPIVGLITAFRPWRHHPDEGAPFCLPHELYVDVVCSYSCPRGCGRLLVAAFLRYLRTAPSESCTRAVRLYATDSARIDWANNWNFVEAETRVDSRGRCVYTDHGPRNYAHEIERGWGRTWRMTLIL